MTCATWYYGWEALCEAAFEPIGFEGRPQPSAAFIGLSHLRNASVNITENLERYHNIGDARNRKVGSYSKGMHEPTVSLTMWLPNDMGATCADDLFLLKAGMDQFNVAHDASKWVTPNTGTSIYGSNCLPSLNIEIGHNKSGNIRAHHVTGCVCNTMNITAAKGEKLEISFEFMAKIAYANQSQYTNGSATRNTEAPLNWSNCEIEYGTTGTPSIRGDFTSINISFENALTAGTNVAIPHWLVDDCDLASAWTGSTDCTPADNTTTYKTGSGSLDVVKNAGSEVECSAYITSLDATDLSGKRLNFWVYIADAGTLANLDTSTCNIVLGTAGFTNTNVYDFVPVVGWKEFSVDIDSPDSSGGAGADETLIDNLKVFFTADSSSDTWSAGDVLVDFIHVPCTRSVQDFIPATQVISGTLGVNMTTESGMEFYDELYGSTSDPLVPADTGTQRQIVFRVKNLANPSTQKMEWTLYEIMYGEVPMDIDPEKVQEISIPYTAGYYKWDLVTTDAAGPSNFDDQS